MRWLVIGSNGMLGRDATALLEARGESVVGLTRETVDVTDTSACEGICDGYDVVVNCAAYTAVDAAEGDEGAAFAVNAVGAANIARAARAAGARLVHVSTDYVFDGNAAQPYTEAAAVRPASAYGRTKAAGEWAVRSEAPDHLIVRTAWLYGAHGPCFPKTIVRALRERGHVEVIDDQSGQPTWTVDLADLIYRLVVAEASAGTYHGTSSGATTWFGFAVEAARSAGMDDDLVARTSSADFVRPAPRPAYSVLGHDALIAAGVAPIEGWSLRWGIAAATVLAPGT